MRLIVTSSIWLYLVPEDQIKLFFFWVIQHSQQKPLGLSDTAAHLSVGPSAKGLWDTTWKSNHTDSGGSVATCAAYFWRDQTEMLDSVELSFVELCVVCTVYIYIHIILPRIYNGFEHASSILMPLLAKFRIPRPLRHPQCQRRCGLINGRRNLNCSASACDLPSWSECSPAQKLKQNNKQRYMHLFFFASVGVRRSPFDSQDHWTLTCNCLSDSISLNSQNVFAIHSLKPPICCSNIHIQTILTIHGKVSAKQCCYKIILRPFCRLFLASLKSNSWEPSSMGQKPRAVP